jgi:hypothetical protein
MWRGSTTKAQSQFQIKSPTPSGLPMCRVLTCFVAFCLVHKDNKNIFTHATDHPAGRTREKVRLDKSESFGKACAVAKALCLVTHSNIEYRLKRDCIEGMKSQINKNKISNINNQIQMMKNQEELLVTGYGREQYNCMNGLPGLVKQQVAPAEAETFVEDDINDNDDDN